MPPFAFIAGFFASKQIFILTAYLCWSPELRLELARSCSRLGISVLVRTDLENAPAQPARPSSPRREGVLLDANCSYADVFLSRASSGLSFTQHYVWLMLADGVNATINSLAGDALPDSDVTWLAEDRITEAYRVKENQRLQISRLPVSTRASFHQLKVFWTRRPPAPERRRDLGNITLSGVVVVTEPTMFHGWDDLSHSQLDTFPKYSHPLMMLIAEDLNYRYNLRQVQVYGAQPENGSFHGASGMLQRRAVVVGVSIIFMRSDRWNIMDFVAEAGELRGIFIFRQPQQSAVTNVFLLPFSAGVWAALGGVLAATAALVAALASRLRRSHPDLALLTLLEAVTFSIGTICQQGTHVSAGAAPVRIAMFSTLVCSLFAFTAYGAKVVAILQAPSNALQTIDDLSRSHMEMGVQNTSYRRVYFAESPEPATQRLYRRKLLPHGEAVYMSAVDGIERMRQGGFAFQVEHGSGYTVISRTFTEREKCGLKEITAFRLPMCAVPLRKYSGYKELFATRMRWQREVGLMVREWRRWVAERPRCPDGGAGFLSVALTDVLPAFQILWCGGAVSCALLAGECALHRLRRRKHKQRTQ